MSTLRLQIPVKMRRFLWDGRELFRTAILACGHDSPQCRQTQGVGRKRPRTNGDRASSQRFEFHRERISRSQPRGRWRFGAAKPQTPSIEKLQGCQREIGFFIGTQSCSPCADEWLIARQERLSSGGIMPWMLLSQLHEVTGNGGLRERTKFGRLIDRSRPDPMRRSLRHFQKIVGPLTTRLDFRPRFPESPAIVVMPDRADQSIEKWQRRDLWPAPSCRQLCGDPSMLDLGNKNPAGRTIGQCCVAANHGFDSIGCACCGKSPGIETPCPDMERILLPLE